MMQNNGTEAENPGGYVPNAFEFGYSQETHQEISIGSPYLDGCGPDSRLKISNVGISEGTHQGISGKNELGPNESDSKIVEQGFSQEIGVDKVLGVPIGEEMEKVSLVGACNGAFVDSDVPSCERDGSLITECENMAMAKEINIESPYQDVPGSVSGLNIAGVEILEETHQGISGSGVLGPNGSESKIVEQGFSHEVGVYNWTAGREVEFGVLGLSIEKEMENVSLVGDFNGNFMDSDVPSGEGDGSLMMECEKIVMWKEKGNGGSEVNAPDTMVNMVSNVTEKNDAQSGEIVSHKDEGDGGGDGSLTMESKKIAMSKENGNGESEVNVPDTMVNVESNVTEKSDGQSGEIVSHKVESDGGSSDCDYSSDSSSSSSEDDEVSSDSSSSSSEEDEVTDDDEEEVEGKTVDIEEGEIRDLEIEEMALSSGDEEEGAMKGPIKSKNELEILPPVPSVNVVLEPHHQALPVGVILSIMGTKVIVEGAEKHNPLNEGSILWITETRSPLGLIDEIFGPVKNPYYIVRYNSEQEVPAGICQGTAVSFVADFADHVLNDKNLYKKGYDASGENDEELSDELEFSDDEKEVEYKRYRQIAKRGKDDRKHGIQESVGQKKVQVKGGFRKNLQHPVPVPPGCMGPRGSTGGGLSFVPNLVQGPSLPSVPLGCGNCGCSHGPGQVRASGPPVSHMTPPMDYLGGPTLHSMPQPNTVWSNGITAQQQHMRPPSEFSMNGMQHHQQQNHYHHQQQHQPHLLMGFPNGIPFQPQFNPSQMQGFPNGMPFQPQFNSNQMQGFPNGMPCQPQFNLSQMQGFPDGMPCQPQFNPSQMQGFPDGMPCQPQFNPSQMQGFPNGMPGQPQFNPSQMQAATAAPSFGNTCVGSAPTSLTGTMGSGFNQMPFGMGIQSQGHCPPHVYGGMSGQGDSSSGQLPPSIVQGGFSAPRQFSPGMASNRGRTRPPRGGRSNFSGGRGPKQNR